MKDRASPEEIASMIAEEPFHLFKNNCYYMAEKLLKEVGRGKFVWGFWLFRYRGFSFFAPHVWAEIDGAELDPMAKSVEGLSVLKRWPLIKIDFGRRKLPLPLRI